MDRPLGWAAQWLSAWYGQPASELARDERELPAVPLWLLRGDAVQRATAAWHLGWPPAREASGSGAWSAPFLARALDDSYAAVRYLGYGSLRKLPGFEDFAYDFVPPQGEHAADLDAALARWISLAARGESPPEAAQVLFRGPGSVDTDLVRRLEAQRVERALAIYE